MVLGVVWLKSVRWVQTDYRSMSMKFILKDRKQKWMTESLRVSLEDKGVFEEGGMLQTTLLEEVDEWSWQATWTRAANWTQVEHMTRADAARKTRAC